MTTPMPGMFTREYQMLEFTVVGKAVPKRFIIVTLGKKDDPDVRRIIKADTESENWMKEIENEARTARALNPGWVVPVKGTPVKVTTIIFKGMAASWSPQKQGRLNGKLCADPPDTDNVTNSVHDALQGHRGRLKHDASPGEREAWHNWKPPVIANDCQIASEVIEHRWCMPGEDNVYIKVEVPEDD